MPELILPGVGTPDRVEETREERMVWEIGADLLVDLLETLIGEQLDAQEDGQVTVQVTRTLEGGARIEARVSQSVNRLPRVPSRLSRRSRVPCGVGTGGAAGDFLE